MIRRTYACAALISLLCGCALTATSGPVYTARSADPVPAVSIGANAFAFRKSSGTFGFRVLTVAEHGLKLRSGAVHAGWDFRVIPGHLVIEPGFDLGIGSPANIEYENPGAYAGFVPSVRWRLWGVDDSEPAFNLIAPSIDLVLLGRAGAWMPPEGSANTTMQRELGVELGLRVSFGSDLFAGSQGRIRHDEGLDAEHEGATP